MSRLFAIAFISLLVYSKLTHAENKAEQRVISLAPHLTEMVYSLDAGHNLIGVVEYSDYPADALNKPLIGSANRFNFEKIIQLKPTLILAWQGGNRPEDIQRLKDLGFTVYLSKQHDLNKIANEIRTLGKMLNREGRAETVATKIENELANLKQKYKDRSKIRFFYQIWNKPLITINGSQFISQGLNHCNAENIFALSPHIAPAVSPESVIKKDPNLILIGGAGKQQQAWQAYWKGFGVLQAAKNKTIFTVEADLYQRPTERFVMALGQLCKQVDSVR